MKGFTFATVAALAATSFAATVKLQQTPCIQANATSEASFDIESDKLVVVELPTVCGLKIVSADGVDVSSIKCQAYKDAAGTEKGSSEFTSNSPALISTNPVQVAAILCIGADESIPSAAPTTFAVVSTSAPVAAPTGGASPTGGPSPTGGNGTAPTAPSSPSSPTATPSSSNLPGSASTVGMSFGALAGAAIAMFFL